MRSFHGFRVVLAAVLLFSGVSRAATFNIANGDVAALKAAITTANGNGVGDTINLASNGTYTLTAVDTPYSGDGLPAIGADSKHVLILNGNGATIARSSAAGTPEFRVLHVGSAAVVTINNLTITGGAVSQNTGAYGGGIYNDHATLTVNNCTFNGNSATYYGGGIYSDGSDSFATSPPAAKLTATNCTFTSNNGGFTGGGIASSDVLNSATVTVTNCNFTQNVADYGAGLSNGAFVSGSGVGTAVATVQDCVFDNNHANSYGGAIDNGHGTMTVTGCTIQNNTGSSDGGAIVNSASLAIDDTTFDNNSSNYGGAIKNSNGALSVVNSSFSNNVAAAGNYGGGGAIWCEANKTSASVNVANCTFTGNHCLVNGGAIYNFVAGDSTNPGTANLDVTGCVFTGNYAGDATRLGYGGAISSSGGGTVNHTAATINNCTFKENFAYAGGAANGGYGGALHNTGTISATASTFDSNSADNDGGALYNQNGIATLTKSTFFGNYAKRGGAIANYNYSTGAQSFLSISSCTFSRNESSSLTGDGLYAYNSSGTSASIIVRDNLLQNGGTGGNLYLYGQIGAITSQGYNLSDDSGGGYITQPTDKTLTDALLDPAGLKNNGGPTSTIALLPGSPAIDQGNSFGLPTDQRGKARIFNNPSIAPATGGDDSDIGAFEANGVLQSGVTLIVNSLTDHDDGACTTADCTLREAVLLANARSGADTITFAANVRGTLNVTSALPGISTPITLQGPGASLLTLQRSGNKAYRFFYMGFRDVGTNVTISGLTFSNGNANDGGLPGFDNSGGALYSFRSTVNINNCAFIGNNAASGGAIFNDHGTLTVSDSTLSGNTCTYGGAGIYNESANGLSATLTLSGCTLVDNAAARDGGGLYNEGINSGNATATVNNCTFKSNSAASSHGGAFYNNGLNGSATLTLSSCTLNGNTAPNGSSLYNDRRTATDSGTSKAILRNSIFRIGIVGTDIVNSNGTITSQGFNLSSNDSSSFLNQASDLNTTDPKLGALSDNGGPTQTMALMTSSPAIDKGKSFGLTTDQRGTGRPSDFSSIAPATGGDNSDIGAFEVQFIPTISVNNPVSKPEGSAATPGSVNFDVTLNSASAQTVTVNYQTKDGTAFAASDYVAKSGKLSFAPGETLKRVTVKFVGDSAPELDETFGFNLDTPTNATLANSKGVGTIGNDDGLNIAIADATTINEGDSGLSAQSFVVRLSAASSNTVTVNWATANGTATAGSDYVAASGVLKFSPGQTSKIITVQVNGDTTVEPNETYKVNLSSASGAVVSDAQGIATIRNDDSAGQLFNDEPSQ